MYVRFGYTPLEIFNHTQEQVPLSMNDDPINMIRTSQQHQKEGMHQDLQGDFRNSKEHHLMKNH